MYRKFPSLLALVILSSLACAETEDGSAFDTMSNQDQASSDPSSQPGTSNAYTRDSTPMRSPDAATQACFDHVNTVARFPDPSSTRLLSSAKRWVTVKDVGGRQIVTIGVTSKNEAGMYVGVRSFVAC